jgi:hypothetical protein
MENGKWKMTKLFGYESSHCHRSEPCLYLGKYAPPPQGGYLGEKHEKNGDIFKEKGRKSKDQPTVRRERSGGGG